MGGKLETMEKFLGIKKLEEGPCYKTVPKKGIL